MRRILKFDHSLIFSFTLVSMISCTSGKAPGSKNLLTNVMAEERNLVQDERSIATRICYAYQSKSSAFKTQVYFGGTFTFNVRTKSCGDASENYTITSVLQQDGQGRLVYTAPPASKSFEGLVQTNTSGYLSQLCTKIQTNQSISNTTISGGMKVQIEFTKTDLDGFVIRYFSPSQGQGYVIQRAESLKVRTQFNSGSGQILGMDEVFSRQEVCPVLNPKTDPAKASEFTQTFSRFVL